MRQMCVLAGLRYRSIDVCSTVVRGSARARPRSRIAAVAPTQRQADAKKPQRVFMMTVTPIQTLL